MTKLFDSQKLISLRQARFWTQEDLAAASGLSSRTIQRIERDGRISVDSWKAIAAAFNFSPESLMKQIDPIDQYEMHQSEMKRAVTGAMLCAGAGLIGCSFGWWMIFTGPTDFHEAVSEYALLSGSVTFATALCLIIPVVTWKRSLR